jgi:hypothetical protein
VEAKMNNSAVSSDYDVIVLGGGAPGEHCAAHWPRAGCASRSSSATWSTVSAPIGVDIDGGQRLVA